MGESIKYILTQDDLKKVAIIASQEAIETYQKEVAKENEKRRKRVLNNVKVLLKNYRRFKGMVQNGVYGKETSTNDTLVELLEIMQGIYRREEYYEVASIKDKVARTSLILEHIDSMLEIYRRECDRSIEGARRYRVIYSMFLSDEPKTTAEIAAEENVVERTVFRDIKIAYDELAVLFFGVDGIKTVRP